LKESSQTLAGSGENEVQLSVHSVGVEGWNGVRVLKGLLKESSQTLAGPGEIEVQLSVHSVGVESWKGVRVLKGLFEGIVSNPCQVWRKRGATFRTLGWGGELEGREGFKGTF
jgi:hypothetical protein